MNDILAPLYYVSPVQINFQVPYEVLASEAIEVRVVRLGAVSPPIQAPFRSTDQVSSPPKHWRPIVQRHPNGGPDHIIEPSPPR